MHIIIDGYNLIGRGKGLRGNIAAKRKKHVEDLSQYHRITGYQVTVVFDARHSNELKERQEWVSGVLVIYSRPGEQADDVIAKLAGDLKDSCIVVTSDRNLRGVVTKYGSTVMYCGKFESQLHNVLSEQQGSGFNDTNKVSDLTYEYKKMDALERAKDDGIDLTLLYENLTRTPTERIENFLGWLEFVEELQRAKEKKGRKEC